MKLNVKYLIIPEDCKFEALKGYMRYISEERKKRIERFRFERDKIMSLYTELFIRSELSRKSGQSKQDILFEYSERGKPFLAQNKDLHFSVSHSGNCIVFAGHTLPVGVDVEKIKEMREKVAKRYFTEREQKYIFDSQDKDIAFYYIWTRKEAYLKKTGDGLSKKLISFEVLGDAVEGIFKNYTVGEYMISVSADDIREHELYIQECTVDEINGQYKI